MFHELSSTFDRETFHLLQHFFGFLKSVDDVHDVLFVVNISCKLAFKKAFLREKIVLGKL